MDRGNPRDRSPRSSAQVSGQGKAGPRPHFPGGSEATLPLPLSESLRRFEPVVPCQGCSCDPCRGPGGPEARTGPEIMASKEAWKIQREKNCNTSLKKTGSNLEQRMRAVQEEKVKVNYGQQGNVTSIVMSQKTIMEGTSSSKGSKAGASLMGRVSRPAIAD